MRHLLAAAVLLALVSRGGLAQPPRVPVLVELYTSEGCSSCPPADALLASLLRDQPIAAAQVVPIGLHVDYFNHLGWKDGFSSPAYTALERPLEVPPNTQSDVDTQTYSSHSNLPGTIE